MLDIVQSKRVMKEGWQLLPKKILVQMLRNQVIFYNAVGTVTIEELARWCDKNCNGLYRISDPRAYFEEEADMVAFKVYWHGQEKE